MDFGFIFLNIGIQLFYFVGVIFLMGYLISVANRFFYELCGFKRGVCYATGLIGTPIHELGHALMCLIFGHRITEMRLFRIDNETGVLGYVRHSYNKKNLYHQIGNYFIGVAPIACGTLVIYLLMLWLLPETFSLVAGAVDGYSAIQSAGVSAELVGATFHAFWSIFSAMMSGASQGFVFWIFLLVAICIALHMNMSGADMKGALPALLFLIPLTVVVNLVVGIFGGAYVHFVGAINTAGAFLTGTLILSLTFSLICVLAAGLVRFVIYLVKTVAGL